MKRYPDNYRPPEELLVHTNRGARLIYKGNIRGGVLSNIAARDGGGEKREKGEGKQDGKRDASKVLEKIDIK